MSRAATMPTTPGCQPSPAAQTSGAVAARRRLRLGGHPHGRLDLAPLGVQRMEPRRERRGLVDVGGREQPRAEVGCADPPAGIDPRPDDEAEAIEARRAGQARRLGERDETRAAAAGHHRQALAHQRAVEPDQRRDVGDGRERHEIERAEEVGTTAAAGAQQPVRGDQHQEDDPCGAEIAELAGLVLAVGVHHGIGRRQHLGAEMVVEHDHVAAGGGDRLVAQRAAVDADDEVVAVAEPPHRRHVGAVALLDPVGDVERRVAAHRPQPAEDQRRRGAAVDVVVGEDGDPLAPVDRGEEPRRGAVHVAQARRVGHQVAQGGGEERRRFLGRHAAPGEDAPDDLGQPGRLGDRLAEAVVLGARADPAPPGCRGLDVEEGGRFEHAPSDARNRRRPLPRPLQALGNSRRCR